MYIIPFQYGKMYMSNLTILRLNEAQVYPFIAHLHFTTYIGLNVLPWPLIQVRILCLTIVI